MKIALMADSTGITQDFMDQYEIPIAPLSVAFDDGETFTENDNVPIERFIIKWLI